MPIFVINLDRSTDRLAHVAAQLDGQQIGFERIAATDGAALPDDVFAAFAAARPRAPGLVWRRGQAGCFLSHWEAWERIVDAGASAAAVLEDDIRISPHLGATLADLSWVPPQADIVRIETTGQWLKLRNRYPIRGGREVARVVSSAWATGGYLITRAAAARLLATEPRSHMPVDAFLFDLERSTVARGLETLQLLPALVTQDKFDTAPGAGALFGSEIEGDNRQKDPRWQRLRRSVTSRLSGKSEVGFR